MHGAVIGQVSPTINSALGLHASPIFRIFAEAISVRLKNKVRQIAVMVKIFRNILSK